MKCARRFLIPAFQQYLLLTVTNETPKKVRGSGSPTGRWIAGRHDSGKTVVRAERVGSVSQSHLIHSPKAQIFGEQTLLNL